MCENDHTFVYYCIQLKSNFCNVDIIFVAIISLLLQRGWDGLVGVTIRYWLECPGMESRWGKFCLHGVETGPGNHPPPVQRVPGLFSEIKMLGSAFNTHPLIAQS